ncbi:MAG: hypothetical protein DPW18_06260 [Chloroflexi bacterium]|nr:hypothetical protein [Chloroflexota bacterium]MDL1941877.1 hypothetical protein [Chloroflexi bacterium CFX2]
MKPRFIFWTFNLVAVILTASCAPAAVTEPPAAAATIPVEQSTSTAAPTPLTESTAAVTDAPTIQPIATSRGPSLEATDPSTVSLASGQLQLVEFFRFT